MFLIAEISGLCLIPTFDADLGYFLPDQPRDGTLFYLCPSFSHAGRPVDSQQEDKAVLTLMKLNKVVETDF